MVAGLETARDGVVRRRRHRVGHREARDERPREDRERARGRVHVFGVERRKRARDRRVRRVRQNVARAVM